MKLTQPYESEIQYNLYAIMKKYCVLHVIFLLFFWLKLAKILAIWLFDCTQKAWPGGVSLKRALKM